MLINWTNINFDVKFRKLLRFVYSHALHDTPSVDFRWSRLKTCWQFNPAQPIWRPGGRTALFTLETIRFCMYNLLLIRFVLIDQVFMKKYNSVKLAKPSLLDWCLYRHSTQIVQPGASVVIDRRSLVDHVLSTSVIGLLIASETITPRLRLFVLTTLVH
jgi:hypothetical protein